MAAKVTAPSAQIFTSDPLEQIMARGVMDRDMSGLAYMFLNAFGDRRQMDQESYMKGVSQSNQQAQQVAEMEARQKMQEEFLKSATKLAEMGNLPSSMPILQQVFRGGATDMDQGGKLNQDLIRSKIAANNRDPNGGDGGLKVKVDIGDAGSGFTTIEGKGPNSLETVRAKQIQLLREKGIPINATESRANAEAMLNRRNGYYGGNVPQ